MAPSIKRVLLGRDSSWWSKWYILDYSILVALFIFSVAWTAIAVPYHRYHHPDVSDVVFPSKVALVSDSLLYIEALLLPAVVFAGFQVRYRSQHDFHHAIVGLLVAQAVTYFFTAIFKVIAGRERPLYDPTGVVTNDTRSSFPSGHSSASFCGMVFLSMYITGKLRILSNSGHHSGSIAARMLASFIPLFVAMFISVSRTMDNHHHYDDILAGATLGAGCSAFIYFGYFPSLFNEQCHKPKPLPSETPKNAV